MSLANSKKESPNIFMEFLSDKLKGTLTKKISVSKILKEILLLSLVRILEF
jgi:hypothetical protein